MTPLPLIRLESVSVQYRGHKALALNDISLTIDSGECCLLLGKEGAGKTTLLRLLFGALRPIAGRAILDRWKIHSLSSRGRTGLRRQVGIIFQDSKLVASLPVYENVALPLEIQGISPWRTKQKVSEALERTGMLKAADLEVRELSAGEQQRVALARAIVRDPKILLADEPTSHLDLERGLDIVELFSDLHRQGMTMIIASHNPGLMERLSYRKIHLAGGALSHEHCDF